jgi:hypothetical protein
MAAEAGFVDAQAWTPTPLETVVVEIEGGKPRRNHV